MPLPSNTSTVLVNTIDDAMDMKRWLGERRDILALDTETSGLDPRAPGAKLRLVQIGDHETGWAIPWEQWGGVAMECLNAWEGPIALHNAAFDVRWLGIHAGWEAPWHRIHDTMIMAQICDPLGPGGLKPLGNKHIDKRASAGDALLKEAMAKEGWGWENIPVDYPAYWAYGALDTIITAHLWSHFRADQAYPQVYELEMAARRVVSRMEDNGARIDIDYCEQKYKQLNDWVAQVKAWGQKELGFSIGSNVQLIKYFKALGADITRTTKSGAPSVDKYQLKMWVNNPPSDEIATFAKLLLDVRHADKMANSYFKNFLEMHTDGVVHPSIKTLGARTGRMSMTTPALQTLPKGEALVRDAFIPHEGHVLVSSDWSQIEMRLMAHFSQDERLAKAFHDADASGGDFFVELGKEIYRDPNFMKSDKRRGLVKNTLYAAAYGGGVQKMAETAGVPYDVMKAVADGVFSTYPGIKKFQAQIEDAGVRRERSEGKGYVLTPYGRRLPCDEGKVYTLQNYILQGHAAELLKNALVQLDLAGLGDAMLLPVHDEVIFSVPKNDVQEVMHLIQDVMSITEGYAVDIPAEPEGPLARWGEKYRDTPFDAATSSDLL